MKSVQKGFTLIELMIVVAIIAILAAIAIPQYQAYVIRSQVTRVMGEAGDQKVTVEDCLNNGYSGAITTVAPAAAPSCVLTATSSDLMSGLAVDSSKTTDTIKATFGNHANAVLKAATTTLSWNRAASGAWSCHSTVISKYLPPSCTNP
jgi:type IV pilus assembly protein PilA